MQSQSHLSAVGCFLAVRVGSHNRPPTGLAPAVRILRWVPRTPKADESLFKGSILPEQADCESQANPYHGSFIGQQHRSISARATLALRSVFL